MSEQVDPYVPGDNFCEYAERFEQYLVLNEIKNYKKIEFLLIFIGQETYCQVLFF